MLISLLIFSFSCASALGLGVMSATIWIKLGHEGNPLTTTRSVPILLQILGFTCLSFYLFFKPDILYGIPRAQFSGTSAGRNRENSLQAKPEQSAEIKDRKLKKGNSAIRSDGPMSPEGSESGTGREIPFNKELMAIYAGKLEAYIVEKEVFRRKGYTVNELAIELRIPAHHLSYVLNHYYHQRFTDFINSYRVNYIKDRLDSDTWKSLTLEGLAGEAGFSSRSTFFAAFKKVTGLSPSQYLQPKDEVIV